MTLETSLSLKPNLPVHLVSEVPAGHFEIFDPASLFAHLKRYGDRRRAIDFQPRPPKGVGESHVVRGRQGGWDSRAPARAPIVVNVLMVTCRHNQMPPMRFVECIMIHLIS